MPEEDQEAAALALWKHEHAGHVFASNESTGTGHVLVSLGPGEEARREPISISSTVDKPEWRVISNFAHAPFTMDGRDYASVEGFWQGLKFETEHDRRRLAVMPGSAARREGQEKGYGAQIEYEGAVIIPGTWDHWRLMEKACRAKFTQDADARAALLSTGHRPLEHRMRHDSHTIPGAIMAEIWMRIRRELSRGESEGPQNE